MVSHLTFLTAVRKLGYYMYNWWGGGMKLNIMITGLMK